MRKAMIGANKSTNSSHIYWRKISIAKIHLVNPSLSTHHQLEINHYLFFKMSILKDLYHSTIGEYISFGRILSPINNC